MNKQTTRPGLCQTLNAAIFTLTALILTGCYQNQISHVQFETTRFGAVIVTEAVHVKRGLAPYRNLSEHNAVFIVYPTQQIINITAQPVPYDADAAFINEDCVIVRVLTGIPQQPKYDEPTNREQPDESLATPESPPETYFSSGYPAKYLAMTVAPLLAEKGVRAGQKVTLTGPAARIACD